MVGILSVAWTVTSARSFCVTRRCARCDAARVFESSGKFRVNANGKRVDVWLIYRCGVCEKSWNRTVIERRPVDAFAPGLLDALEANDLARARALGLDLACDGRASAFAVGKARLHASPPPWTTLAIRIAAPEPIAVRLDAVLARALGLSRRRVSRLEADRRLAITPACKRALSRPAVDATEIRLDLADDDAAAAIFAAAASAAG